MDDASSALYHIEVLGTRVAFHLPRPDDAVQSHILRTGSFYEQSMLLETAPLVPDGGLVVDAGANIGNHSLFFAKIRGVEVLAFEPDPAALTLLKRNVALNGLENLVEAHEVSLGASSDRIVGPDAHNDTVQRKVACLDDMVGTRLVHLIKIDVDGMEQDVLRGAAATLDRCGPPLVVRAGTVEALERIEGVLKPFGYRKFKFFNHTPTYLFKKVFASECDRAVERLAPRLRAGLRKAQTIHAGLATVAGNETALRATVVSLLPQVDHLHVYLNGFQIVPDFLSRNPRVSCRVDPDGLTYGDAGKFWGLEQVADGLYLTCDDDILYPDDYVERMAAELASAGDESIVAVHGSLVLAPNQGYYGEGSRAVFHFREPLARRRRVHVAGTATCAFHTETVRMRLADFKHRNMADIWLAQYAQTHRIPAYVVPRAAHWLVPLTVNRETVYEQSARKSGSHYDSSRAQDDVLAAMAPLSLMREGGGATAFVLDFAAGADIASILTQIDFNTRDPVIFVLCDGVPEHVRKTVAERGARYEMHVLKRRAPPPEAYRPLLAAALKQGNCWRQGPDMRFEHTRIPHVDQWFGERGSGEAVAA